MATGEVIRRQRGYTLIEVLTVLAIAAVLVALSANALTEGRRVARVNSEARLLIQRLQTVRTRAVSQGNSQGYGVGPNGLGVSGTDVNQGFIYVKPNPMDVPIYVSATDILDPSRDEIPHIGNNSLVTIWGGPSGSGTHAAPFQIGFDINGQATVTPAATFPYCIQVADPLSPSIQRWVILFNDGTVKVQNNDITGAYCP